MLLAQCGYRNDTLISRLSREVYLMHAIRQKSSVTYPDRVEELSSYCKPLSYLARRENENILNIYCLGRNWPNGVQFV